MSIVPTLMQEIWRPTLQRVAASEGGSRVAAVKPSLPGVVPPGSAVDMAAAVASVLAAIPVPTAGVGSVVTLADPHPPVAVEEAREAELPILPSGGPPGSSLLSGLKEPEESAAGTKSGCPVVVHTNEVVDILSDDKADIAAGPLMSP